ncbi:hypothetical protein Nos7524_5009 [Nostoc sp. PCC 7524]|uniref:hypothetical protein n=1 Tax=Nostoc sp. (strain ATCC 29411 / PCC 7524) TaxID=28072 RepID=UPI00029F02D4|nr:hypothetical protein [Nostoc sp. PCC 7524]AFY50734.1 hypothetical protein Nos7524_5009 [Nostoc sp. PCC 7524]
MSWLVHHTRSEEYASQAEQMYRQQDLIRAAELYRLAAEAEVNALENLTPDKKRTIGITAVSAASLYYKAQEFLQAKRVAHKWLATEVLPSFAVEELEELLQVIRYQESRAKSGIQFIEGEVLVSVSGGEILYGAAPLELVLDKVEKIRNIFYRTTEFLLDLDLRKRGSPNQVVKNQCDPWLLQAPPGSYQFAVRVRKPNEQLTIPGLPDFELRVEQITKKFLEIITATTQDPEGELIEVVPKEDYREAFLKLTRELAPPATGKSFNQMEIKSTVDIEPRPVILSPHTRDVINHALKKTDPVVPELHEHRVIQLRSTLRGLQLDKDWIEVNIDGENKIIYDAKEEIDDVIGRMVNRPVVVEVLERRDKSADKRYSFRDIQLQENV